LAVSSEELGLQAAYEWDVHDLAQVRLRFVGVISIKSPIIASMTDGDPDLPLILRALRLDIRQ
jgi:hypothetical protein